MTPLLLAPLGLTALAALIVPLLIHLRRKTEDVPVDFAAMRWLDALPRPRQRMRFDEWLLLALRLLLVALLALLLARPAVLGWEDDGPHVLVAPGVDPVAARAATGEAEARWIAPGFPELDSPAPESRVPLASLIRQFDAELPEGAGLTVLVPQVVDGLDAGAIRLTRKAEWRVIEGPAASATATPAPAPALAVRHPAGQAGAVRYFRAAADAWSATPQFSAEASAVLPPRDAALIWLTPGPVPQDVTEWVNAGGTALLASTAEVAMPAASAPLWTEENGETLAEGGVLGAGRLLRFTRALEPATMPDLVAPAFAATLRDLVSPPAPPPARLLASAAAPVAGASPYPLPPRELSAWLVVLIALTFAAERGLATRASRFAG